MRTLLLYFSMLLPGIVLGQETISLGGQFSGFGAYSPDNVRDVQVGVRFIPELEINLPFEEERNIDILLSLNLSASSLFSDYNSRVDRRSFNPYRIWVRYTTAQLELRLGLQNIEFGSATILRPLQWFTSVDSRDPLQLTDGVYGALARYYFVNNANVWIWLLRGNSDRRGLDILLPEDAYPEIGGRFQYPINKLELAASFHHRKVVNPNTLEMNLPADEIQNRIGIDGKFDLVVGLWFETSYSNSENWNQKLLSLGSDYSFAVGNGLNVSFENLHYYWEKRATNDRFSRNYSSLSLNYPLSFFDQISSTFFYEWGSENLTVFLNYGHQFTHFDGYLMAFYNPDRPAVVSQVEFIDSFSGPGIRGMVVVNF